MPVRCVFCGSRCRPHEPHICDDCFADLPWCERLVERNQPPFASVVVPLEYAFPVDAALKSIKFRRRLDYVPAFAELLWRVSGELPRDIDAFLPVPLHWRRQTMRGFNQARELASELRCHSGLPEIRNVQRLRATPKQSGLDARQRRRNLQRAFVARGPVTAAHVLIVDDIVTTGETGRQLGRVVLAAGAKKVSLLAVAKTDQPGLNT